tara:strand:- start:1077 stop:2447 length:1371 start_codon:yes stop_codon:yes gene_type:complete
MGLRPYQRTLVNSVLNDFLTLDSLLAILPTGAGKTFCFVKIAKECLASGKKVLALMHRENLVNQAAEEFRSQGIDAEVEMGSQIASYKADVVVGSIQTFSKERMTRWPRDHFRLVIVDEAHHVEADSWQETVRYFKGTKLLGVTATPSRADGKDLGNTFQKISHESTLIELIEGGWLSPITVASCPLGLSLSRVKSSGDYQVTGVDEVLSPFLDKAAQMVVEKAKDRKTIVFLPLRATSKKFADALNRYGMKAHHVEGGKGSKDTLKEFREGGFQAICNASLLIEGYDCPEISCVVPLRPTKSFPLFAQMVGRGTRIYPGKEDLLLLDFLWEHEKHKLIRAPHLFGANDESIDSIFDRMGDGEGIADATRDIEAERTKALERKLRILKKKKERIFSLSQLSSWVGRDVKAIARMKKGDPPTNKQLALLKKFHVDVNQVPSREAATKLIGSLLRKRR